MKVFLIASAGFISSALCVVAAESAKPVAPVPVKIIDQFLKGGFMMYPLTLLSFVTMLLIFIYLLTIRRSAVVSDRFMVAAENMIQKRDFHGLLGYCQRQNASIARVTQRALEFLTGNPQASINEVREVAGAEGSRQAGSLSSRITYLADIGAIAPLLGLLGTVFGMIKSFAQISAGEGATQGVRQFELANGVSEALICTASGLAISIPALIFYSIFRGRVHNYIGELEAAATHLLAMISTQLDRPGAGNHTVTSSSPFPRPPEDYSLQAQSSLSPIGGDRSDLFRESPPRAL